MQHWVRYVVEVDVVSYFDSVNWAWLRKFVRHRVNDGGLIRLLNKWLKAGVMDNGVVILARDGVPQGGPVTPSFAKFAQVGFWGPGPKRGFMRVGVKLRGTFRRTSGPRKVKAHGLHYGHPGRKLRFLGAALSQKAWLERHTIEAEDAPAR